MGITKINNYLTYHGYSRIIITYRQIRILIYLVARYSDSLMSAYASRFKLEESWDVVQYRSDDGYTKKGFGTF